MFLKSVFLIFLYSVDNRIAYAMKATEHIGD